MCKQNCCRTLWSLLFRRCCSRFSYHHKDRRYLWPQTGFHNRSYLLITVHLSLYVCQGLSHCFFTVLFYRFWGDRKIICRVGLLARNAAQRVSGPSGNYRIHIWRGIVHFYNLLFRLDQQRMEVYAAAKCYFWYYRNHISHLLARKS